VQGVSLRCPAAALRHTHLVPHDLLLWRRRGVPRRLALVAAAPADSRARSQHLKLLLELADELGVGVLRWGMSRVRADSPRTAHTSLTTALFLIFFAESA
jgi:hypothetical protein